MPRRSRPALARSAPFASSVTTESKPAPAAPRRIAEFREVTTKVVNMLAERAINVTQEGVRAYVQYRPDGSIDRVNIPYIPDTASDQMLDAIRGYIDHEVAHVLFTIPADSPSRRHATHPKLKLLHSIYNILEDTRIEREMRVRFPGSAYNLDATLTFVLNEHITPMIDKAKQAGDNVFSMLVMPLMRAYAGQHVASDFLRTIKADELCAGEMSTLAPFQSRVAILASTVDATNLAVEILAALSPPEEPSSGSGESDEESESSDKEKSSKSCKSKSKKDKSDKSEKPEKGDKSEKGADASEDEDADKEETEAGAGEDEEGDRDEEDEDASVGKAADETDETDEGKESKGQGEDGEQNDDSKSAGDEEEDEGDGESSSHDESEDEDASTNSEEELKDAVVSALSNALDGQEMLANVIETKVRGIVSPDTYLPFTVDLDKFLPITIKSREEGEVNTRLVQVDERLRSVVGQLQAQMRRLFAQQSVSLNYGGQRRGRLQSSALHRLRTGDDRVFMKREEHASLDTAVTLLIDLSGSMNGEKVQTACMTGYALCQILDRLNIQNEVLGFTTEIIGAEHAELFSRMEKEADRLGRRFSRVEPINMFIFKSFAERLVHLTRQRFVAASKHRASNVAMRNNIDGESVMMAARRLLQRREPRKILMVLSDGAPSATYGINLDRHLRDTVKAIEKLGVETIGIGIMDASVKDYYPKNVVVNRVEELPGVVMTQLRRLLLDKRPAAI